LQALFPEKGGGKKVFSWFVQRHKDDENFCKTFFCFKEIKRERLAKGGFFSRAGLPDLQTKNLNLGKFLRVLQWKMLVNLMYI
jgi:hypothetical protein